MTREAWKFRAFALVFLVLWTGVAACSSAEPTASDSPASENEDLPPTTGPENSDSPLDATAPETLMSNGPANQTTDTFATFLFRANETDCSFECRLDDEEFAPCSSAYTRDNIGFGQHVLAVRALDASGNPDPTPAEYRWEVILLPPLQDLQAPETLISSGPAALGADTAAAFAFSANEPADFECRLDGAAFAACASPHLINGLAPGSHAFEVRATDAAGNADASPAVHAWQVTLPPDTRAPETTLASQPASPTSNTTAEFTFQADEAAAFECDLDNAGYQACVSPHTAQNLTVGTHVFSVRARDAAGNTDPTPASASWEIQPPPDTQDPITAIESGPADPTTDTSAEFAFSSDEAGAAFECRLDGAAFAACASPHPYSGLSPGAHTFEVRSTDASGNTDDSPAAYSWNIAAPPDTQPPETAFTAVPTSGQPQGQDSVFAFSSNEAGAFECRLDGAAFAACASPITYNGLAVGTHQFEVRARDAAGNADSSPAAYSWLITASDPLGALSDNFNSGSLDPSWQSVALMNGQAFTAYGFQAGSLTMDAPNSTPWYNNNTSSYLYKLAQGNFKVTTRVHVRRRPPNESQLVNGAYQVAGIMVRSPSSGQTPNSQNTVHIALGDAAPDPADRSQIETKTTENSASVFQVHNPAWLTAGGSEIADADLRICRFGTTFYVYARAIGQGSWTLFNTYPRPNTLGASNSLQAGLISYSNITPDLRAVFEEIKFATVTAQSECAATD